VAHTFNSIDSLRYEILQWTPAIQAGLTTKRLTFRHVFLAAIVSSIFVSILCLKRRQNLKFYLLVTLLTTVNDGSTFCSICHGKAELKMEVFVVKGAHNDSSIMLVKENKEKHSWQRC
jgi:hypothetical protein